jgi:hypothetical protein
VSTDLGVPLSFEPKRTLSQNLTSGRSHLKPEVTVKHTTSRAPFGGARGLGSVAGQRLQGPLNCVPLALGAILSSNPLGFSRL